jgi:hypothetical protein
LITETSSENILEKGFLEKMNCCSSIGVFVSKNWKNNPPVDGILFSLRVIKN